MRALPMATRPLMRRLTRSLGVVIALLGMFFVTRELTSSWDEVREATAGASVVVLSGALVVGSCGMLIIGLGWRRCLAVLGCHRPVLDTLHRYYVGQLGKYVPGGIWSVLGRGEMARRGGVAGGVAYGSTVISLGITYLAAVLLAALSLASGAARGQRATWLAVLALLPLGLLALHPRVVRTVLAMARRMSGRDLRIPVPAWGVSLRLLGWHIPAWLAIGGATWLIAATVDPAQPEVRNIALATVLSWVVGFLVIPAPGGIGVREAVFVATATSISSPGVAAAVAITARVTFVLVDVTGAAVTTIIARRRSRHAPSDMSPRNGEPTL